jgi:hypothetical protein
VNATDKDDSQIDSRLLVSFYFMNRLDLFYIQQTLQNGGKKQPMPPQMGSVLWMALTKGKTGPAISALTIYKSLGTKSG